MNARDSEFVAGILVDAGFALADSISKADIVIYNSCSVRQHAEEKLFSNMAEAGRLKKKRPELILVLMGCAAQNHKEGAVKKVSAIDIVCGPGNEADLPALIKDRIRNRCTLIATDKVDIKRPELFPRHREGFFKAYVSISEGCDNFCSYCIVPYVRGAERSRDAKDVIREVRDLASRGFKEITLLGQNVNSYQGCAGKGRRTDFPWLLEKVNGVKGIERIRFMTSHPKDADAELFRAMAGLEKVCEHLHLPLQSGSDRVLKLMNRKYTAKKYMEAVSCYRKYVPYGSITTDVVVGFPSETEKDFRKTRAMIKNVGFDSAYTFKYSPRPPAKSAKLEDDVAPEAKTRRLMEIVDIQCAAAQVRNEAEIGKVVEVLVDGVSRKESSKLSGRTRSHKTAVFNGPCSLVGSFVNVEVMSVTPYSLKGRKVG